LGWRLWSVAGMRAAARALLLLAAWQFASGLTNVVLDWPLLAAVGHTGGAAALVIVLTGALCATRRADQRDAAPSATSLHLSSPIR
ncbi:MAG: heme A synthase, partial [Sphingobium sp.]